MGIPFYHYVNYQANEPISNFIVFDFLNFLPAIQKSQITAIQKECRAKSEEFFPVSNRQVSLM